MLNKNGERELAYIVNIDAVFPIEGADNCEGVKIGGWNVMVKKGEYHAGDKAVYFEIDSKVNTENPAFAFLEKRNGKIKTQKYTFGGKGLFYSQGLVLPLSAFGWKDEDYKIGDFVTQKLGVVYAVEEDNARKEVFSVKDIERKHKKISKTFIWKKLMKTELGRRLLMKLFGRKKKRKNNFPTWVKKTDEERVQNLAPGFFNKPELWIATEKIDGSSATYTIKSGRKDKFWCCSRNVGFATPQDNIYFEIEKKYSIERKLREYMKANKENKGLDFLTIQGEIYGEGVQKRKYIDGHDFAVFNVIIGYKNGERIRLNPRKGTIFASEMGLPYVPILEEVIIAPETTKEEILALAKGISKIDGKEREGIVFRSLDGKRSFKAVDNDFLLKYHAL